MTQLQKLFKNWEDGLEPQTKEEAMWREKTDSYNKELNGGY